MSEELQQDDEEQPHLLLVDDDPTFTRVMARAMLSRGLRVSVANSAEEGLAMAREDLPDYAVLDLKMDGDSGLVLLPMLLELDSEMRVVILTGYSSIATAVEAIKRGACNYLCKPADADDVLTALRRQGRPYQLTASELARESLLSSGAMTNRIDRLEERGLVEREADPDDRRGVLVRLTEVGLELVDKALEARLSLADAQIASLTPEERQAISLGLRKVMAATS